jgi:hypothetical protein
MVKTGVIVATTQLLPEWKAAADEIWAALNKSAQVRVELDEQHRIYASCAGIASNCNPVEK